MTEKALPQEQDRPQESGSEDLLGEGDTVKSPQLMAVVVEIALGRKEEQAGSPRMCTKTECPSESKGASACLPAQPPPRLCYLLLGRHPPVALLYAAQLCHCTH